MWLACFLESGCCVDISQFSPDVQKMAFYAQRLAHKYGHTEILPQHVLLAMVQQPDSMVRALVIEVSGGASHLSEILQENLKSKTAHAPNGHSPRLSASADSMFDHAQKKAENADSEHVCCEYVLLAMLDITEMKDLLHMVNVTEETLMDNAEKVRCARTPKPNWW